MNSFQDTEDDQTCLEEFQECLEEYQECLEVIHIGVEEDTSFNTSSCTSRSDDLEQYNNAQNKTKSKHNNDARNIKSSSIEDSDLDVSFKSTNNKKYSKSQKMNDEESVSSDQQRKENMLNRGDSQNTQSDRISSEREGYETCMDESLSEDVKERHADHHEVNNIYDSRNHDRDPKPLVNLDDHTPTNCDLPTFNHSGCNRTESETIPRDSNSDSCLDQKTNSELKSYDNYLESNGSDEFFLVDYPREKEPQRNEEKINYMDSSENFPENNMSYTKCLKEYYNDIQECMKAFMDEMGKEEMCDNDIFNNIILPFKCRSAPNVMDRSFVMITYDPGPEKYRRRSAFETVHEQKK